MTDTLNRGYPYPAPTADPDVPYWLQRLAEDVDADMVATLAKLAKLPVRIAAGTANLSVGAANTNISSNVNFGVTFDSAPLVLITGATNALKASVYSAYSSSTTGFTAKVQTADGSTYGSAFSLAFTWVAIQMT